MQMKVIVSSGSVYNRENLDLNKVSIRGTVMCRTVTEIPLNMAWVIDFVVLQFNHLQGMEDIV